VTSPASRSHVERDKSLLYAEAIQHSVLGSVLLDASLLRDPLADLAVSDFFGTADQTIYSTMLRTAEDGEALDHLVLAQAVEGRVENAGAYIGELIDGAVADRGVVKRHAETLQRLSQLRRLRVLGETLERETIELGADPAELIETITQQFAVLQTVSRRPARLNIALRSITAEDRVASAK
jgi:replicative DNA helicase